MSFFSETWPLPNADAVAAITDTEEPSLLDLDVLNWRFEELERAGYPVDVSIALSARADIDLHVAVGLLHDGATVTQALRMTDEMAISLAES